MAELGITETENGYKLGDQDAGSIDELDFAKDVMMEFADAVAKDLTQRVGIPGAFYYGFKEEAGDSAFRLFFGFKDTDIPELNQMGAEIEFEGEPAQAEASFDQILAALEDEGCHDLARKLHSILREN